ncbi:MAG: HD domain-containing protein [Candidatus Eremiobacteraeota bacterium]|nr:HD domain-containing protein [Candidatus Eremiobacteraeota bacterium]
MSEVIEERASFHAMTEGTQADWKRIEASFGSFAKELPDRMLGHLRALGGDYGGYAVDRFHHSLQTATRALRDGRDEEYVVCALLHDIGDLLGPYNHADIAASMLKPFISEQNHWMLEHHGMFQGYYFFHYIGLDRNMREQFAEHPWYGYTRDFCELYDQNSFDPDYDTLPLEAFEPMVRRVLAQPKKSIYIASDH